MGTLLNVVLAASVAFPVLPGSGAETFAAFSLVIGPCLAPIGTLLAQARPTLADRDVYRDDDDFYAAARTDQPDDLRHGEIEIAALTVGDLHQ